RRRGSAAGLPRLPECVRLRADHAHHLARGAARRAVRPRGLAAHTPARLRILPRPGGAAHAARPALSPLSLAARPADEAPVPVSPDVRDDLMRGRSLRWLHWLAIAMVVAAALAAWRSSGQWVYLAGGAQFGALLLGSFLLLSRANRRALRYADAV